jgi:pyridinium-3,5-biscarboxylic acid mononucleotide synthase
MVRDLLRALARGELTVAEAARRLEEGHLPAGRHARFDFPRVERTGLPEIVLGEGKSPSNFLRLVDELHGRRAGTVLSRLTEQQLEALRDRRTAGWDLILRPSARMAVLHPSRVQQVLRGATAALLTGGTADASVAEEVELLLESLGARVVSAFDVGVAGLHRLARALPRLQRARPSVYVVCAGREGALATVVAGLVDRPVVGVPTSHGYGRGGRGEGALTSMLQSCAPIAVVNIDGGVPAALVAAQILRVALEGRPRAPYGRGARGPVRKRPRPRRRNR